MLKRIINNILSRIKRFLFPRIDKIFDDDDDDLFIWLLLVSIILGITAIVVLCLLNIILGLSVLVYMIGVIFVIASVNFSDRWDFINIILVIPHIVMITTLMLIMSLFVRIEPETIIDQRRMLIKRLKRKIFFNKIKFWKK